MRILATAIGASVLAAAGAGAAADSMDALLGKALFERDWIAAPASTDSADGLGPLFAARSCAGCHTGKARAARFTGAVEGKLAARGLVLRLGDAEGSGDPVYGHLLQTQAVDGVLPEGRIVVAATGEDGYALSLNLARGDLDPATRQSARIAPPLSGRAALQRIEGKSVLALADPEDRDGDGVSGRARLVARHGDVRLGRYGWKAGNADLAEQVADAFAMDIGLSSVRRPSPHGDCTALEPDCLAAPAGASERHEGNEISEEMIALVAEFVASLDGPPKAAASAPGAGVFAATGCAACHVPSLPGTDGEDVVAYTDLLLHDMGTSLDDGMGEVGAASAEWRTAPLIAMGLGTGRRYLHDGRAATLDAAIRAHGGEGEAARARYEVLSEHERQALLAFVAAL
jgi:CxxC motif-containing protein (DUF1111 family)